MIKALIKNRIRSVLSGMVGRGRGGTVKKASIGKIIAFAVLYIYLIVFFGAFSAFLSLSLGATFIPAGASWVYFAMFIIISASLIFVFSIFETKSELFECKDNDLLLSMPIKPRDIVLSRIFTVLLYNYIIQALIMLPCIIVYAIISHDAVGTIGISIISLFIPLFSTSLASGVGYLTALIAKKLKKNSFVTVGIAVVFLLVYFFGYDYLMEGFNNIIEAGPDGVTITKENAPLLYAIGASALMKPLNFIAVIAIFVISALMALYIIAKNYIKVIADNHGAKKAVYKGEKSKQKSPIVSLASKELLRFTSSATYMLNSGLGIIFQLIIGVVAIVESGALMSTVSMMVEGQGMNASDFISPIMIAAIFLLSSMNMMSASALSLEGKNLWIIKSLPIKDRDVLIAKTIPHIVVSSVPSVISSILFMIAISASPKYWVFFILTPLAATAFSAFFGIVINVQFPKFDYQNEAQPVKQSMPVFIVMTVQMLLGFAVVLGNLFLSMLGMGMLAAFLTLVFFSALAAAFLIVLLGPSARKYATYNP